MLKVNKESVLNAGISARPALTLKSTSKLTRFTLNSRATNAPGERLNYLHIYSIPKANFVIFSGVSILTVLSIGDIIFNHICGVTKSGIVACAV